MARRQRGRRPAAAQRPVRRPGCRDRPTPAPNRVAPARGRAPRPPRAARGSPARSHPVAPIATRRGSATPTARAPTPTKAACAATQAAARCSLPCVAPMACVMTGRRVTRAWPGAARSARCVAQRESVRWERKGSRATPRWTVVRSHPSARPTVSATMVPMVIPAARMRSAGWRCGAVPMRSVRMATRGILASRTATAGSRVPGALPMGVATMGRTGTRVSATGNATWAASATPRSCAKRAPRETRASQVGWTVPRPHRFARPTRRATTGRTATLVLRASATLGCCVAPPRPVSPGSKATLVRAPSTADRWRRFAIPRERVVMDRWATAASRGRAAPVCCAGPDPRVRRVWRGIPAGRWLTAAAGRRCAAPTGRATMEVWATRAANACRD